jgi:hypoxanthine-DNA glycosylase
MESSGLDAIAPPDAEVLILGSLPGAVSLELQQYYAHPRNAFWRIMADVTGVEAAAPYETRQRALAARRLALWDVCARAVRPGSLDADIRHDSIRPNDFAAFFAAHPGIRRICFNGTKARVLFERLVLPGLEARWAGVDRVTLPSTSPAHASMSYPLKRQAWRTALTEWQARG